MNFRKKKKTFKNIIFSFLSMVIMVSSLTSCGKKEDVYISWVDADGALIEYITTQSSYNPANRTLPQDTDTWHYLSWNINQNGKNITCTAIREKKFKVKWTSADGKTIAEKFLPQSDISEDLISLPEDTDEWHYTEWAKGQTSDGIVFKAQRVHKTKHIWKDTDGSILKECYFIDKEPIDSFPLPANTEKWIYTEWTEEIHKNEKIYTAQKIPNEQYFAGNVFQIIVKDKKGEPLCSGSGIVINDEGWFITNNHVMKDGNSAVAFFDIRDDIAGTPHTKLNIIGGSYYSKEKDIFIGKIENYDKIKKYYHTFSFTETYAKGENVYTIGYPNSSIKMEINSGEILEEYSNIFDKINGVYYILSDSYIAPGSSGGILINENFEIVGITTMGLYADASHQVYRAGGSIPTFIFKSQMIELHINNLKTLEEIYKN